MGPASDRLASGRRGALLVFLAALCYFAAFHRYGLFLQDEGVIAYQALRVSRGELPYSDFQTAYTPAGYYLHALLFEVFGPSLSLLRATASVACAATAALLYVAAVQVLCAPYTLLPSLLYVLLEDQESGGLVVHTMAYPARYITTLWALSLCLGLAHHRRRRAGHHTRGLPLALGLVTAGIVGFKHTAGIYNAWAVGLVLMLIGCASVAVPEAPADHTPPGTRIRVADRAASTIPLGFLVALLIALLVLFGRVSAGDRKASLALCVPLASIAVLLLGPMFPWRGHPGKRRMLARTGIDLCQFGVAAAIPTLLWSAYFGNAAGFDVFLQRLILDGPAVARSYAIPFPAPEPFTLMAIGLTLIAGGAHILVRMRVISGPAGNRFFALTCGGITVAALVWTTSLIGAPFGWADWPLVVMHVGRRLDNLAFYVAAVTAWAFLPGLAMWLQRRGRLDIALLCWVHCVCQLLLAYPRLDVAHLYEGAVTALLVGTVILERTVAAFRRAVAPVRLRWLPVAIAMATVMVCAIKLAPRLHDQLAWDNGPRVRYRTELSGSRGGLYGTRVEDRRWLASLNQIGAFVRTHAPAGSPIFTYPALSGIYFLTGRDNPTPMDYFYHGFGEGTDEIDVVDALERTRTPMVILMDDYSFDPTHLGHFPLLKDYVRRHFVQTAYIEPFRVLERVLP